MDDQQLETVKEEKDLGVQFSDDLKSSRHVRYHAQKDFLLQESRCYAPIIQVAGTMWNSVSAWLPY